MTGGHLQHPTGREEDSSMTTGSRASEHPWHAISASAALKALDATETGLNSTDARKRLAAGSNEITGTKQESVFEKLAESVTEPLQLLLLVVAFLSALGGTI